MVRVEWMATSLLRCMKLTTMVQNWARVRTPSGLNRSPPVPLTTPMSRRMSALTAVASSRTSTKEDWPAAWAGGRAGRTSARARMPAMAAESSRLIVFI